MARRGKQIRADLKKQLKRKPSAVELIFLGSGIRPIAELLTVHRVSELTKLDIHVRFYDVQFESEVDPRLDREERQLLGGVGLQEAVPSVATVELRREPPESRRAASPQLVRTPRSGRRS